MQAHAGTLFPIAAAEFFPECPKRDGLPAAAPVLLVHFHVRRRFASQLPGSCDCAWAFLAAPESSVFSAAIRTSSASSRSPNDHPLHLCMNPCSRNLIAPRT
jgi:hypothetical protein